MTENKIFELIKIGNWTDNPKLTDDVMNDYGFDSLDCVEFIMILEEEFNIDIPDDEAEELSTVSEIINYIKGKLNDRK